jgi:hypothetical protein
MDEDFRSILTPDRIHAIVGLVPDDWLIADSPALPANKKREVYEQFLNTRLSSSTIFVNEAQHARKSII